MKNKANILFISYDGMTDPLGQSQVIPYLTGLTKHGYQFTILSCEKRDAFNLHKKNIKKTLENFSIKWEPIPYHKKPPVLSSVYDVWMLKKKAKQLHTKEKFDMVHTRAGIPSLIGLWMKKKFGIKFLHDIREFYADSRIDGGMWNNKIFFYREIYNYFKKTEKKEIENCDGMVCLTYVAEKIIKQLPHCKKETILEVIPCSVDMELFSPCKINLQLKDALRQRLNIHKDDCIVSYLGSIGGWYLTDEMMQLCKHLSDKIANAKFLFISPQGKEIIYNKALHFGIQPQKIIVQNASRQQVPLFLSLSNYSVFFIKPCYSKQSSSPTKHAEIMAMGIPVITNSGVGDVAEIVTKYHSGIVVNNFDNENYIKAIEALCAAHFDSNEIRNGAQEFYSLENAIEKYKKVYDAIIHK